MIQSRSLFQEHQSIYKQNTLNEIVLSIFDLHYNRHYVQVKLDGSLIPSWNNNCFSQRQNANAFFSNC